MPAFRYVVCDVFTDRPLAGNQLAVFTDAREIPEGDLQRLARELNLSETTYVYPPEADGHVKMRIFTPSVELPFAGHPTLGTAFVLAGPLQLVEIRLETARGTVPVRLEREGARISFGWMAQPLPTVTPFDRVDELLAALGVESVLPVELYDNGVPHVFVALASREEVVALAPDQQRLLALGTYGINCFASEGTSVKLRMFGPGLGMAEDPATGSAAGPLALHLARHGRIGFGDEIEIEQGVEIGRPSKLHARVDGTADAIERIEVGGSAVIVARGEFRFEQPGFSLVAVVESPSVEPADRENIRQLEQERTPEDAAVHREVEPVARGIEHPVGIVVGDCDREPGEEAAAVLVPRRAAVPRDRERGPAFDDRDDRRPVLRSRDDTGQPDLGRLGFGHALAGAENRLLLDVEKHDAVDRANGGDHRAPPAISAATSAVARRAAESGLCPSAREPR
jgi:trans-2,3-dihydro-3-hydroxyanthranilate isomerase